MRTRKGAARRRARKRLLKAASGYRGARSKQFRVAKETVRRAWRYSWIHRRRRKRDFRRLWIARINAAARANGITYSQLMHGLKLAGIDINRKMLSEIAIHDAPAFTQIAETAKAKVAAA